MAPSASGGRQFRFRPRFRGIAWTSVAFGAALDIFAAAIGFPLTPFGVGAVGVILGGAYLASPTWRIAVTLDDEALTVRSPARVRFRLPWADVVKVIVARASATAFIDGGAPERSLLVPGDGAPAPYDIERRAELIHAILEHVPESKVQPVASLKDAAEPAPPAPPAPPA